MSWRIKIIKTNYVAGLVVDNVEAPGNTAQFAHSKVRLCVG